MESNSVGQGDVEFKTVVTEIVFTQNELINIEVHFSEMLKQAVQC